MGVLKLNLQKIPSANCTYNTQKAQAVQKGDAGIPAAAPGQVDAGAAEVGNMLMNFAQTVLSTEKSGVTKESEQC